MSEIDVAVEQLEKAILNSKEYLDYSLNLEKLKMDEELKKKVDEFRKQNYLMQIDSEFKIDKLEYIETEYAELRENPIVSDFLAAELALCRMIQGVGLQIVGSLHFE